MAATQRMTAEEYLTGPELPRGTELVEGEVIMHQPSNLHQFVLRDLLIALHRWTDERPGRGVVSPPLDVRMDGNNVLAPDVLWYAEGRAPARNATTRPSPLPDLAIEIRSQSTWRYDIGAKKSAYERHALRELWLVDTAADEVLVFRRSSPDATSFDVALELTNEDTLTSPLLPGFALALAELF